MKKPPEEKIEDNVPTTEREQLGLVVQPLVEFSAAIARDRDQTHAPVQLPSKDQLTVRLVPIHQLQQLDEYRTNSAVFQAWSGVFAGGALGVLCNIAMLKETVPPVLWVLLAVLLFVALLFLFFTMRESRKAHELRDQLIPPNE